MKNELAVYLNAETDKLKAKQRAEREQKTPPNCIRCDVPMKEGTAIQNTLAFVADFPGDTVASRGKLFPKLARPN